jgi:integrase
LKFLARSDGFEPPTLRFEVRGICLSGQVMSRLGSYIASDFCDFSQILLTYPQICETTGRHKVSVSIFPWSSQNGDTMKFTAKIVEALALKKGETERIEWDDEIKGFGIRMRAGGSRNWVFQYKIGDKHRRMTIGAVSAVTVSKAREHAGTLHAKVKLGDDPAAAKAEGRLRAPETFQPTATRFLMRQKARLKPRTYAEVERHLLTNAKSLHSLSIAGIQRRDIAELLSTIESPSVANHVRASLSAMFAWAMREGLAGANPVMGTNRAEAVTRDRVLSDAELRAIWAALGDDAYGDIVRMLMFTGQRREEIGGLCWSEIDLDAGIITLPPARTKNKREHAVPLSDQVQNILKGRKRIAGRDLVFGGGEGGFSGWSKAKENLDKRLLEAHRKASGKKAPAMPDWRLHDARRSVATGMAGIGILPHVIEAVLNHVSGHKAGVAGVYNRATYLPEKTAALTRWADHLQSIVTGKGGLIVPLRLNARSTI